MVRQRHSNLHRELSNLYQYSAFRVSALESLVCLMKVVIRGCLMFQQKMSRTASASSILKVESIKAFK